MKDKHVAMLGFITGFIIVICISGIFLYNTYDIQYKTNDTSNIRYCDLLWNSFGIDINYNITNDDYIHNNFSYIPHYVKFHIYPNQPGINVSIKMNDDCFKDSKVITKYTDNNSEIILPMISSAKYNILIDDNRCSYYIYPIEDYYNINCSGDKK